MNSEIVGRKLLRNRAIGYAFWAVVFVALSVASFFGVYQVFAKVNVSFPTELLSLPLFFDLVLLLTAYYLSDGLRLSFILKTMGYALPLKTIMRLVFINFFVSNVTPMASGGGFTQIYFLNKEGVPAGIGTAATSIRTVLAMLMVFTAAPVFILTNPSDYSVFFHPLLVYSILFVSIVYLGFFAVLTMRTNWLKQVIVLCIYTLKRVHLISSEKSQSWIRLLQEMVESFADGIRQFFKGKPTQIILSVGFTAAFLIIMFSFLVVLMRGMGLTTPLFSIMSMQTVITFFSYFAPSAGGTGVVEGGFGLLFSDVIEPRYLVSLTILWRVLTIYIGVVIGVGAFYLAVFHSKKGHPHAKNI